MSTAFKYRSSVSRSFTVSLRLFRWHALPQKGLPWVLFNQQTSIENQLQTSASKWMTSKLWGSWNIHGQNCKDVLTALVGIDADLCFKILMAVVADFGGWKNFVVHVFCFGSYLRAWCEVFPYNADVSDCGVGVHRFRRWVYVAPSVGFVLLLSIGVKRFDNCKTGLW